MGNIKSKSPRNNCEFEVFEQEIIPTDNQYIINENFDPPDHIKPVDNFVISKLAHKKTIFLLKNVTVKAFPNVNKFSLCFEYDTAEPCTVIFKFGQKHMGLDNGVPRFSKPNRTSKTFNLEVGNDKKFELEYSYVLQLRNVTLDSASFTTERKFVPILIVISSLTNDFTYFAMCGLKKDIYENWNIYVTKRRIKVGSCGYLVQEVYGLNESEYGIKKDQKDERIKNCAICLETPSNTILLPCSHICLCSECSKTVSIQFGACPMCRTVVSQILHINDHR
ncbi:Zinc finger C3HC4 type (RING finger) family protein [Theileria parva strain Muguga]|uniref:Zinc finger C3HC4 type (RING finger) family protein n=1 Tax=Theileria parva strain Muguga TaxID=333668 RepID=UPI001C620B75|nr:Zinc finger C3HC4 type (RING finger) family protein [Theileria parva strain Muguga]EAN34348.2 Zinc finger C3HC4 type (RING finger) family protein [Theileria parva strain Muguga]